MPKPRVVYWNNMPSPYMVDRFNAFTKNADFEFEAWFNEKVSVERSWNVREEEWMFRYRYVPNIHMLGGRIRFPLMLLEKSRPDIIVMLHAEPVFLMGWLMARARKINTGFRVLLTHDRWVARHWTKELAKRYLFSRVDFIETHGKDGKQYAMRYGIAEDKVFITTHTVDLAYYDLHRRDALTKRDDLRSELGLIGITYIYVGRLWWGKGIEYLLAAFKKLQRGVGREVSLLLVGDGEEEDKLRKECISCGIDNVVFAGFQQKERMPYYYAAADVFVFPTLGDPYGLVVDEAMACFLPVVSTTAAGEIGSRVEEGVNGYLVPPEDSESLALAMRKFLIDPGCLHRLGKESRRKVESHTPEQWAEDFGNIIDAIIS